MSVIQNVILMLYEKFIGKKLLPNIPNRICLQASMVDFCMVQYT